MSHLPFIEGIKERDPKFYETVSGLEELCFAKSSLDQKTKMMIALAVDACMGSASGVKSVANALRGMGVTDEQIGEVLRITYFAKGNEVLSVSMNAFDQPKNLWA